MTDRTLRTAEDLDALDFERGNGFVPVVVQDAASGEVLMLAYANRLALDRSLETGQMHFWSRSRAQLWRKGERVAIRSPSCRCTATATVTPCSRA